MFVAMQKELMGHVPGLALPLAKSTLQLALGRVYDSQLWSFQMAEGGWLTPGLMGAQGTVFRTPGTITVAPYSTTLVGDAVASALWLAQVGRPFITEQQIRVPAYSLYNIVAYDDGTTVGVGNYPLATLTLDRPWMEPAQVNGVYMIYQAYFPVPDASFKKFIAIRDTTNNAPVDYWSRDQQWLSVYDPQRTVFDLPSSVVAYEPDMRAASATLGNMMYELWPQPLSRLPYTFTYLRRGPMLTLPTDTVPFPITEEVVMWRAKEMAFLWKEAQKGDGMERGSGADWRFLAQAAEAEYKSALKEVSRIDQNRIDLYWSKFRRGLVQGVGDGYETVTGNLNVGSW